MEPRDNFDEKFKSAASHDEQQSFPSLDRVWDRVEAKMDHKALTSESRMWKKWAIAASVLLVGTIGYQILKPNPVSETVEMTAPELKEMPQLPPPQSAADSIAPILKPEASEILQRQISETAVAIQAEPVASPSAATEEVIEAPSAVPEKKQSGRLFEESDDFEFNPIPARGVKRVAVQAKSKESKEDPLFVLDGKISTKAETDAADAETIVKLEEPLYIINGKEYSEKEMFGPNPTSPYAPLADQDIESISVLQGKEATDIYGAKGRKGVVIVKTKDGKPKPKKAK